MAEENPRTTDASSGSEARKPEASEQAAQLPPAGSDSAQLASAQPQPNQPQSEPAQPHSAQPQSNPAEQQSGHAQPQPVQANPAQLPGGAGPAPPPSTVQSHIGDWINALSANPLDHDTARGALRAEIQTVLGRHPIATKYNILIFYDDRAMVRSDADKIYRAITAFQNQLPLLLVIYSGGGDIDAGYLIGKVCKEYARPSFVVVVPRQAKSSATLICCAADEIHMGSLSDLGPIDPQFDGWPALGLKYSVEHLAELVGRYPAASEMFADYLHRSLQVINLGYYERAAESAVQYAERLLDTHRGNLQKPSKDIAKHLVYFYKDHGFVIDKDEATSIFGGAVVRPNTEEYKLGNELYEKLAFFNIVASMCGYSVYQVGSATSDCELQKRSTE